MPQFILASSSPRRKQLLQQVHYSFSIQTQTVDEQISPAISPKKAVQQLAMKKAQAVWKENEDTVVLGADTIVALGHHILGKPKNEAEAINMLNRLSNTTHSVYTGVCIYGGADSYTFYEKTDVTFYLLNEQEIDMYIKSGEPFDKAGSYGIQALGAYFVKEIKGDYYTVVGLPLAKTMRALQRFQIFPRV